MNRTINSIILTIIVSLSSIAAKAQDFAVKTNLLYDATTTINLGAEFSLAPKWTIDISGNYNAWDFCNNTKFRHWLIQPEGRYWLCEKFNGHFFAGHLLAGEYNAGNINLPYGIADILKDHRIQGYAIGAGIGYGYHFILGKRWGLELEAAIGYVYLNYDIFECVKCGDYFGQGVKNYFGPTKLGITLVYLIK